MSRNSRPFIDDIDDMDDFFYKPSIKLNIFYYSFYSIYPIYIYISVNPNSTIRELKEIIQKTEGLDINLQILIYNKIELEDSKRLIDYDIINNDTLFLYKKL